MSSDQFSRLALITLLLLGAFFRFYRLDQYPLGVHQDELSNIYDGYSLAETGADRFGDSHPAVVRAFGERDYRPSLYAWLASVPERFTGLSVTAGRLPAAVLGTISLILIFGFARRMAGGTYALFALLFATFSPLHIQLSRVAHEGGILPGFFMILVLYLWLRSEQNNYPPWSLFWVGLAAGISANSYQATRLTAPLLTIVIAVQVFRLSSQKIRALVALGVGAFLGALPQIVVLLREPSRFAGRAQVLSLPANNPIQYVAGILHNYWMNLAPHYLFVPRMLRGLTIARLLPIEILFFYVGLIGLAFLTPRTRARIYVYLAFVIALLPAAVTTGNPSTMRSSAMSVLTPLFSAAGVIAIAGLINNVRWRRRVFYPATVASVLILFSVITYRYAQSEYFRELSFQKIAVDMARKAGRYQKDYDAVFIERYASEPYIYIAAFSPMTPQEFQRAPKRLYSEGMDVFTRLGKYYFVWQSTMPRTIEAYRNRPGRYLIISPTRYPALTTFDSVSFQDQKLYFERY